METDRVSPAWLGAPWQTGRGDGAAWARADTGALARTFMTAVRPRSHRGGSAARWAGQRRELDRLRRESPGVDAAAARHLAPACATAGSRVTPRDIALHAGGSDPARDSLRRPRRQGDAPGDPRRRCGAQGPAETPARLRSDRAAARPSRVTDGATPRGACATPAAVCSPRSATASHQTNAPTISPILDTPALEPVPPQSGASVGGV